MSSATAAPAPPGGARFFPIRAMRRPYGGAPSMEARFALPARRDGAAVVVVLHGVKHYWALPKATPERTPEELDLFKNTVIPPDAVFFVDPRTSEAIKIDSWVKPDYFGLSAPPLRKVGREQLHALGRLDEPRQPPEAWRAPMAERIHDAVDLLLPPFADQQQALSGKAATAAGEFRDLFPELCEPGLLPYYKAMAKDFFAWVEKVAPPERMALPWRVPGAVPPAEQGQPAP